MSGHSEQRQLAAIVFTDIVGSTQLKTELSEREAAALIKRHHALLRKTLGAFREGKEIETAGDSFLILFGKPSDAVQFALLLQSKLRALARERHPICDRIGIHVGEILIEEGDAPNRLKALSGIQVDTSCRVMSLAGGEQILMTRFAFDNARAVLRGEEIEGIGALQWMNHGPYVLKGVEEPVEICEVGEVGLAPLTAPANSDKARRHLSSEDEPVLGWRPALEQPVPNTKWILEKKLGEGGFGEVWLGRHETLKERRVFKFCFRADRVRSLKREVTLFRLLKERVGHHPNIVGIQEVFFDQPPYYIVMDYAEGQDLRGWCETQGGVEKIPLATRLEIVAQVADALQAAHEAGVIHRDVKPSNILVSGERREARGEQESGTDVSLDSSLVIRPSSLSAKLTDFGIGQVVSAEALAGMTRMGFTQTMMSPGSSSQTGTHLYMAPELMAGKPASTRSDIYSLGVVLYQLLIGDFSRPLTTDWARRISDPLLREDLEKCFAGDPAERFSDAAELASRLRAMSERQEERAARDRRTARRRMVRRTALTAVVATFAILFLTVSVLYFSSWRNGMRVGNSAPNPQGTLAVPLGFDKRHLVLLPLRCLNTDEKSKILAEGMTEELNAKLTQIGELRVSAQRSANKYATNDIAMIGRGLEVGTILEGSLRRDENQIRINLWLTDVATGKQFWATNYSRADQDLLAIQSAVAQAVADALQVQVLASERKMLEQRPTENLEAYSFDLAGRAYLKQSTREGVEESIKLFQKALQFDPKFAVALADLSRAYTSKEKFYDPGQGWDQKALEAVKGALALNRDLAEAYAARGDIFYTPARKWDATSAVRDLRRALALNPNLAQAHEGLAFIFSHCGLLDETVREAHKVLAVDPLNNNVRGYLAQALCYQGKYGEALQVAEKTTQEWVAWAKGWPLAINLFYLHQTNKAAGILELYFKTKEGTNHPALTSIQAILHAAARETNQAEAKIQTTLNGEARMTHFHHAWYHLGAACALMNQTSRAIDYLGRAAEDGFRCYPYFENDPNLRNLRGKPEFDVFLKEQKAAWVVLTNSLAEPSDAARKEPDHTTSERLNIQPEGTTNKEAQVLYRQGRLHQFQGLDDGKLTNAIRYYKEAIAKDPNYARAYAGLADSHALLGSWESGEVRPKDGFPAATRYAEQALRLDPNLSEAHASMGYIKLHFEWDWRGAEEEFKRAIDLNPNYATAHHWYSHYLVAMKRFDESLSQSTQFFEADPTIPPAHIHMGWHFLMAGDADQAVEKLKKNKEEFFTFSGPHHYLGWAYEQKSMFANAIEEIQKSIDLSPRGLSKWCSLAHVFAANGQREEALEILEELRSRAKQGQYVSPFEIGLIHAALGEKDNAFAKLNEAYAERSGWMAYLNVEPRLKPLRDDPRFKELVKKVGLPEK